MSSAQRGKRAAAKSRWLASVLQALVNLSLETLRKRGERSETILSHLDCRDAGLVAILALVWAVIASTKMVSLIHNHSFGLKLWRVVGVILMLTQSGCDVKDNRIKKRRLRARREFDRSEAATIKRRVRARLRVARMMTKLSLPDRAAPAVVTPSTPAVAPSAAKGAFGRVDDSE